MVHHHALSSAACLGRPDRCRVLSTYMCLPPSNGCLLKARMHSTVPEKTDIALETTLKLFLEPGMRFSQSLQR